MPWRRTLALLMAPFYGLGLVIFLPLVGYLLLVETLLEAVMKKTRKGGGKKGC